MKIFRQIIKRYKCIICFAKKKYIKNCENKQKEQHEKEKKKHKTMKKHKEKQNKKWKVMKKETEKVCALPVSPPLKE